MHRKLKILLVLQTPWGTSLGMSKVHYELKRAYEDMGHQVDYLDASKIYPKGDKLIYHLLGFKNHQERILDFLKDNAHKYDVIDANQRCIPYSKESFGFKGRLIFRSHGLFPLYRIAEQHPIYKRIENSLNEKRQKSLVKSLGELKRYIMRPPGEWALWDSIKYADIVHVLNKAEYEYLKLYGVDETKLKLVPNGLDDEYIENGKENINSISDRTEISFVGSWTFRKGIDFLPEIIDRSRGSVSNFNLLGTGGNKDSILKKINNTNLKVNVSPHFQIEDLPLLLKKTKVGVFPSFAEGFGLAIVEQLALGIPVVAFDIPGPSDILKPIENSLIVPVGDINAMIERLNSLLSLSEEDYWKLAVKCIERAHDFKNEKIANQFIEIYKS